MEDIAKIMSSVKNDDNYVICIQQQKEKICNKKLLPSNLVIDRMKSKKISFYEFCMQNIWEQKNIFHL